MAYKYGLPFTYVLAPGEYFPPDQAEDGHFEVMAAHWPREAGGSPLRLAVPGPDDEEGEPTERLHTIGLLGRDAYWVVTGAARLKMTGAGADTAAVLARGMADEDGEVPPPPVSLRRSADDSVAFAEGAWTEDLEWDDAPGDDPGP